MTTGTDSSRMGAGASGRALPWASVVSAVPIYLGFAGTGVCVALPGAVLPLLLARWHIGYEGGGRLFLYAWMGSSLGALLVSGSSRLALCASSVGLAAAMVGLTRCTASAAPFWMVLFGTALGAAMTSMTLIRQAHTGNSSRDLVSLNLVWAAGACATPALALHALRHQELRPILYPLAALFGMLAFWAGLSQAATTAWKGGPQFPAKARRARRPRFLDLFRRVPARLILLVTLTTGVEASFGGWLSTYSQRASDSLAQLVAAPTCFWGGLLLSRLFWSLCTRAAAERWIVRGSLLLIAAASLLLLVWGHGWPLLLASASLGFGIGPTYPLLLARTLRVHSGGAIFFLAGVASACLPWLTGVVSTHRGSLKAGLLVPGFAAVLMVALAFTLPLSAPASQLELPSL